VAKLSDRLRLQSFENFLASGAVERLSDLSQDVIGHGHPLSSRTRFEAPVKLRGDVADLDRCRHAWPVVSSDFHGKMFPDFGRATELPAAAGVSAAVRPILPAKIHQRHSHPTGKGRVRTARGLRAVGLSGDGSEVSRRPIRTRFVAFVTHHAATVVSGADTTPPRRGRYDA